MKNWNHALGITILWSIFTNCLLLDRDGDRDCVIRINSKPYDYDTIM